MTLIELLVGLAVASIVSAVVMTGLAATAVASRVHQARVRGDDIAWLALEAIMRDLAVPGEWRRCTEARDCGERSHRSYRVAFLQAATAGWLVDDVLRRCTKECEAFAEGIVSLEVVADIRVAPEVTRRVPYIEFHGDTPVAVELTLTRADGRRFSRVMTRGER